MLLRTRILLLVAAALLLVGASVGVPAWMLLDEQAQQVSEVRRQRQGAEMARVLDEFARPLADAARALASDSGFAAAVSRRDTPALRTMLARWRDERTEGEAILRAEVVARGNQLLAAVPAWSADEPLVRSSVLIRDLQPSETVRGIEIDPLGGAPWLALVLRMEAGLISVAAPLDPPLRHLATRLGAAGAGAAGLEGQPLASSTEGFWESLSQFGRNRADELAFRGAAGERLVLVTTELRSAAGAPAARLLVVQDGTAEFQRQELLTIASIGIFVGVVLLTCLLLYRTLRDTLAPLTSLSRTLRSLASGDIFASANVPRRNDEVGEIGRALESLRDSGLALDRMKTRDRVSTRRQQALIGAELSRLASVLEGAEREEADAMLRRLERSPEAAGAVLAEAFERMAAGVLARHHRLTELLEARTRDLEVVRAALAERMQLNRLREELEVARNLQLSSLPSSFPDHPGFRVYAAMLPAKEVGGDFYDFLMVDDRHLAVFIGDASGKGVGAAMFIAMARSLLRSAVVRGASPAEALAQANEVLSADNPTMMFATAFVAILDVGTGTLRFANAGHNLPYLQLRNGRNVWLRGTQGIALGVMEGFKYGSDEIALAEGDTLLLYTDGVTEAVDPEGQFYGEARLATLVAPGLRPKAGPAGLVSAVFADVAAFAREEPQADDITLLCLTLCATAAVARSALAAVEGG